MTDLTPVYEQTRTWAIKNYRGGIEAATVAVRFASWLCGYYADDVGNGWSPDYEAGWARFHDLFSDLPTIATFGPEHQHAHEWAHRHLSGADNDAAERFAAWFCGFYAEEIAADVPGVSYRNAWQTFLGFFPDLAAERAQSMHVACVTTGVPR
jgi:hypothetical protein